MVFPAAQEDLYRRAVQALRREINFGQTIPYTMEDADERPFLGFENYVGIGYGVKLTGGVPQGRLALCAFVVRKGERHEVEPDLLFDRWAPDILNRVLREEAYLLVTDVIEVGRPVAFSPLPTMAGLEYPDRVPGGVEIECAATGTLGCWITDDQQPEVTYLLSCWHVLGDGSNNKTDVLHPAGGTTVLGTFTTSVEPDPKATTQVTIDAAIAQVCDTVKDKVREFVLQIGETRVVSSPTVGVSVKKYGVATNLTTGYVSHLQVDLWVDVHGQSVRYYQQTMIQPSRPTQSFAQPGDSGALVVDDENNPIGLLVGGSKVGKGAATVLVAVATPIDDVLRALETKLSSGVTLSIAEYP